MSRHIQKSKQAIKAKTKHSKLSKKEPRPPLNRQSQTNNGHKDRMPKMVSVPTDDNKAFVNCACGWEWTGIREEGRKLALKLHKKNCATARKADVRMVDWTAQVSAEEAIRTNPKRKGKKARKKIRYQEARTPQQEREENAVDARARVDVESGNVEVNSRYQMEATMREAMAQGKIVIIANADGVPVGVAGDPNTVEYRDLVRALREDGYDIN